MAGCYWLSGATVEARGALPRPGARQPVGLPWPPAPLQGAVGPATPLRSLAIGVGPGFDASQLSADARRPLSRVRELKQTLYTPSVGVVPCYQPREAAAVFRDPGPPAGGAVLSGQLMVGQSSVPHYQHLRRLLAAWPPARPARRWCASTWPCSATPPENLHAFLISVPGSFAEWGHRNLLESMAAAWRWAPCSCPSPGSSGSALLQHMKFSSPFYFSFSRCAVRRPPPAGVSPAAAGTCATWQA